MEQFKEVYMQVPPVTRYYMTITFVFSFAMTYRLLSPYLLLLDFELVFYNFHIWRLLTTFFFAGTFSISFIFTMVMTYYTMRRSEETYQ
mmetsp:Transcript_42901/g.41247  ORF Transcript_42901/g.41247 Transcript_42901/m.41247 type:complete len:89 (+) Transcript_42901:16-282(+)